VLLFLLVSEVMIIK